mgnify:CR=1 FL=1|jgi:Sulfatase.
MATIPSPPSGKYSFLKQSGYVWLLPLLYLLHSYNDLFGFIPFIYILVFFISAFVLGNLLLGICWLITKSPAKSLFITFCCLLFVLFWGAWHQFLKTHAGYTLSRYAVALPVTMALLVSFVRYVIKRPGKLTQLSRYFHYLMVILCLWELLQLFFHYHQYRKDANQVYPVRPINNAYQSCHKPDSSKPDIYFIIYDEYTHNRMLKQLWGFDNRAITNWLQTKGFFIPDSSKANFSFTPYSLSTTFNMNYIAVSAVNINDLPFNSLKAVKSLSENETFDLLQKEHYRISTFTPFRSTYRQVEVMHELEDFAKRKLFYQNFLARFFFDVGWHFLPADPSVHTNNNPSPILRERAQDLETIARGIKATANDSAGRPPQFVYGHLMTTHKPHIFNEDGQVRSVADLAKDKAYFHTYINQVKAANKSIRDIVDHILSHNWKNTIIIIMGDHGFRFLPDDDTRSYFPIFSAFYFPDRAYPSSLSNISAINTFRIVFNQYFCQNLSLLKDSSIIVKF